MYTGLKVEALAFLSELSAKLFTASRQVLQESGVGPIEAHFSFEDFAKIERIAQNFQVRSSANLILVPDPDVEIGQFLLICPHKLSYALAHRAMFYL